jgi:S-formylglutathione hydrolase FrmB
MLAPATSSIEPRFGPNWFDTKPFFALDAREWKPGEPLEFGANSVGFPGPLATLPAGEYRAQAVVRLNPDTHSIGTGEGNAFGPAVHVMVSPEGNSTSLTVDRMVPAKVFRETDQIKLIEIPSPILSAFHKRPMRHRAAVILPEGDRTTRRPTLYIVPGYGGDHHMAASIARNPGFQYGREMLRVVLDPGCGSGHHVFADSAANGPRGKALVEELIPHIEKTFPAIAEAGARLLNGHSSGGWSTLWLQVTYPEYFGGTWSTAPDPVDFRAFQLVDIYAAGENSYRNADGTRRPLSRPGRMPPLDTENFCKMEMVLGGVGQLHSFEAVFSPLGLDGRPRPLWDRATGAIDPAVAKAWQAYDLRLILERNWPILSPHLQGKLHVIVGELDTFYLERGVKHLQESLRKLGSDAVVEIVPGKDHGNLLSANLAARIDREMRAAVAKYVPDAVCSSPASRRQDADQEFVLTK